MLDLGVTLRLAYAMVRGNQDAVVRIYIKELEAEPDHPAALGVVLNHYRRESKWSEVVGHAERALARRPTDFLALDALAWARVAEGRHKEAKILMERALRAAEDLTLQLPSGYGMKLLHTICALAVAIVKRVPPSHLPTIGHVDAHNAEWLAEWKEQARRYLVWYADAYKT